MKFHKMSGKGIKNSNNEHLWNFTKLFGYVRKDYIKSRKNNTNTNPDEILVRK